MHAFKTCVSPTAYAMFTGIFVNPRVYYYYLMVGVIIHDNIIKTNST